MSVAYEKIDFDSSHGNPRLETESSGPGQNKSLCASLFSSDAVAGIKKGFLSLNSCPRELYTNFFLKFCESYGYFALSQVLVIYLHNEFGTSDIEGGFVYGMWGICITFWGLVTSFINDSLGVRRSLMVGFSISFCSSIIIALATSKHLLYFMLFCILPIGTGMGIPMLTVGIKRYTTSVNRGFAFGLYYAVMNIAAFVSGPIIDVFNIYLNGTPFFGRTLSGNRMVIFTTTCTYAMSLFATYYFLREIKVSEEEDETSVVDHQHNQLESEDGDIEMTETAANSDSTIDNRSDRDTVYSPLSNESPRINRRSVHRDIPDFEEERDVEESVVFNTLQLRHNSHEDNGDNTTRSSGISMSTATHESVVHGNAARAGGTVQQYQPKSESFWTIAKELCYSKTFWRFTVLTLFLINLRTIFRHLDATLPTYLVRNFGPKYPKGKAKIWCFL